MYLDNTFKVNLKEGNSESLPSRVHPETDGIPKNIFIWGEVDFTFQMLKSILSIFTSLRARCMLTVYKILQEVGMFQPLSPDVQRQNEYVSVWTLF